METGIKNRDIFAWETRAGQVFSPRGGAGRGGLFGLSYISGTVEPARPATRGFFQLPRSKFTVIYFSFRFCQAGAKRRRKISLGVAWGKAQGGFLNSDDGQGRAAIVASSVDHPAGLSCRVKTEGAMQGTTLFFEGNGLKQILRNSKLNMLEYFSIVNVHIIK